MPVSCLPWCCRAPALWSDPFPHEERTAIEGDTTRGGTTTPGGTKDGKGKRQPTGTMGESKEEDFTQGRGYSKAREFSARNIFSRDGSTKDGKTLRREDSSSGNRIMGQYEIGRTLGKGMSGK
jgi:hypothetical protein